MGEEIKVELVKVTQEAARKLDMERAMATVRDESWYLQKLRAATYILDNPERGWSQADRAWAKGILDRRVAAPSTSAKR